METNKRNSDSNDFKKYFLKHNNDSKPGCAIIIVAIGVLLLGFNLGWFPIEYKPLFISWQMLLIVVGVISLMKGKIVNAIVLMSVGGYFILPTVGRIFPDFLGGLPTNFTAYWPVLLILVGILILTKKPCSQMRSCNSKKRTAIHNEGDFISKDIMFSESELTVFSDDFKGGNTNVGFGELRIDLRKVTGINADNNLEINTMFGSTIIYVSPDINVNMKTKTMFGNIQDKRHQSDKDSTVSNNKNTLVL